jgi:hypothetical protein
MPVIEFACSFCHATVKAPQQAAGKAALCPKCRKKCIVPDSFSSPSADAVSPLPAEKELWDFDPLPPSSGPEPWYFGFLVFFAYLQLVLGVGGIFFLIVLLVLGAGVVRSASYAWISAGLMIELLFAALAILFFAAMILLAVDAARTLRTIRRQIRR